MSDFQKTVTLAMTGASGAQYGLRLLECLLDAGVQVYFLISEAAHIVVEAETDMELPRDEDELEIFLCNYFDTEAGQLRVFGKRDWFSPVASGSASPTATVICPASGGTLSAVASGASNNLIERAADVAIKEKRQLIMVPREMPYSAIHLDNMRALAHLGVTIMPASPGFYQRPQSVEDMVDFVVARVLDHLGVEQDLVSRWGE
ncbi:flavin prenyltransferase UbiX [Porticoccus sp. GXU_MW_L64]